MLQRLAVALVVFVLLTGCSLKFGYQHLDWLISWRLDDYIDWNASQEDQFEQRLREQLAWHRRTQLERYGEWLYELRADLATSPLQVETLREHQAHLREFWRDITVKVLPDAAALLQGLSDEQVDELLEALDEELQERREEYADTEPGERREERIENLEDAIERWTGPLTDAQQRWIAQWLGDFEPADAQWLASRENWNENFARALAVRDDPEAFAERLYPLLVEPERLRDEAYQQMLDARTDVVLQFLVDFHESLIPRQRDHLFEEIDEWRGTLEDLAGEAD